VAKGMILPWGSMNNKQLEKMLMRPASKNAPRKGTSWMDRKNVGREKTWKPS
jgi:hypothetical protein